MVTKAGILAAAAALAAAIGGVGALSAGETVPVTSIRLAQANEAMLTDRNDGATPRATTACADQAWPHVSPDCVASAKGDAVRKPVRVIALGVR